MVATLILVAAGENVAAEGDEIASSSSEVTRSTSLRVCHESTRTSLSGDPNVMTPKCGFDPNGIA